MVYYRRRKDQGWPVESQVPLDLVDTTFQFRKADFRFDVSLVYVVRVSESRFKRHSFKYQNQASEP